MANKKSMNREKRTLVIAEAGVNHNGSLNIAKKLIDAAVEAGADIVKFQTFEPRQLATEHAKQASYQEKAIGKSQSQLEMLQGLVLKQEEQMEIFNYCKYKDIEFLSTALIFPALC